MTEINIERLIRNIQKTNVYTPIIEAIVNSMHAIAEADISNGKITVLIERIPKLDTDDGSGPSLVEAITIKDNGAGFTDRNLKSFDEVYTDNKLAKGGKGFGRLTFLKYFRHADVTSTYEKGGVLMRRSFRFVPANQMIAGVEEEKLEPAYQSPTQGTEIKLNHLKSEHQNKLDKSAETIGRKILEQLLVYFSLDDYQCPSIEIINRNGEKVDTCVLNNFIGEGREIEEIPLKQKVFFLPKIATTGTLFSQTEGAAEEASFSMRAFKVFYSTQRSTVCLVADNRGVTEEALHKYLPEFKDGFTDPTPPRERKFSIRAYIISSYLDENVAIERGDFYFDGNDYAVITKEQIEHKAVSTLKETFSEEITTRQQEKRRRIEKYVNEEAYWHKPYLESLGLASMAYDIKEDEIESELQKIKFLQEQEGRKKLKEILAKPNVSSEEIYTTASTLTQTSTSDLVHYITLRKHIIELFEKSLCLTEDENFKLEEVVHDIIFPRRKTSDNIRDDENNLWMIDERLNFHEYLASDKPLAKTRDRPDILIFNNKISVRGGEDLGNPITIFEFKRPGRVRYSPAEDPIHQVCGYIEQIRNGGSLSHKGRPIAANESTPAFAYIICDITDDIRTFCKRSELKASPDGKGYFGYHSGYGIYIEVISFDKLLGDAKLRNKIFFKKLGIL